MTAFWKHPDDEPPPLGTKIVLLTIGRVAVTGNWKDSDCLLWAPLPKLTKEQKLRLEKEGKGF